MEKKEEKVAEPKGKEPVKDDKTVANGSAEGKNDVALPTGMSSVIWQ